MIKSMTGIATLEKELPLGKINLEIRTLNSRYLETNIRLPKRIFALEERIRKVIRTYISRGRVDLVMKLDSNFALEMKLEPDLKLARDYINAMNILKKELKLKGNLRIEHFIGLNDLIKAKENDKELEPYYNDIIFLVEELLKSINKMREKEGEYLASDIIKRVGKIEEDLKEIEKRKDDMIKGYQKRLEKRVKELLTNDLEVDKIRLYMEIAFLAERSDINEEIVRMYSHISQLKDMIKKAPPIGRNMDFLVQEMNREINTIGAKASDVIITKKVVEIKGELEKIREQIQNIE